MDAEEDIAETPLDEPLDEDELQLQHQSERNEEKVITRVLSNTSIIPTNELTADGKGDDASGTAEEALANLITGEYSAPQTWPEPLLENYNTNWPNLDTDMIKDVESWIITNKKLLVRSITWNLNGKTLPTDDDFIQSLSKEILVNNKYHIYVIGSEECERSIAASTINTSKKAWESLLTSILGAKYVPIRSHTLQATHMIIFVHKGIEHLCHDVTSAAIATGVANTLGNKGAVGISFLFGKTKFIFMNAHLAANQNKVKDRNTQANKIVEEMPALLTKQPESGLVTDATSTRTIFMGDLNYRIRGNYNLVMQLLALNMHEVMVNNDQLKWSINESLSFKNFIEAPLHFKPTYRFDVGTSNYDTSAKKRIPAWCDRILFVPDGLKCIAYNADFSLMNSDHKPVYASFEVDVDVDDENFSQESKSIDNFVRTNEFVSQSQVCNIM
jgi:phosphatidylinositol-bisphosphatase